MLRRSVLTDTQAESLFALHTVETDLIRHYTVSGLVLEKWRGLTLKFGYDGGFDGSAKAG